VKEEVGTKAVSKGASPRNDAKSYRPSAQPRNVRQTAKRA
jgi:hypothetical protein